MLSEDFPWYYHTETTDPVDWHSITSDSNTQDTSFFTHTFYINGQINSSYFDMITPIIKELEESRQKSYMDRLFRVKANLIYKQANYPVGFYHMPHIDVDMPHEVMLYYVNDSDGDTLLFKENPTQMFGFKKFTVESRIPPQKGNIILFDGVTYHAATPPKLSDVRVTINFVFTKEKRWDN